MKIEGGCYCGEIRYEAEGDPLMQAQCHCRECQYITGGQPNMICAMPEAGFKFTKGEPKSFSRSDLDSPVSRKFCSNCGTAIGTVAPGLPGAFIIKVGTMDDPSFFKPQVAIYTKDQQAFHHIADGVASFETVPGA